MAAMTEVRRAKEILGGGWGALCSRSKTQEGFLGSILALPIPGGNFLVYPPPAYQSELCEGLPSRLNLNLPFTLIYKCAG